MPITITIRRASEEDAPALLELACALDSETSLMLLEPGERTGSAEEQRRRIQSVIHSGNGMLFLAENEAGQLVGMLGAQGGPYRRNRETVRIFIGVRQAYSGQGIGKRLFAEMEAWARAWGAHRLELTVMAHNQPGLGLYHKMGFSIEGRLRDALKVDGQYVDEFIMAKILE
jgi:RimJ/RimL family protein N-acetyltransferase